MQQYFQQRLLNVDRRFANNPSYAFAAFACNELNTLENNIILSFMRDRKSTSSTGGIKYSLEDPYTVLDKSPGTPNFFKQKRFELIARLENLGPFVLFFTLSCGEKRYNENFTAFLKHHTIIYEVRNGREECFIDGVPLEDFLREEKNQSKHDFIRENVLAQTLVFDNRLKNFIKHIVMNSESPLSIQYYNYRIEFQLRGAAHAHGTLWVDWAKYFENSLKDKCLEDANAEIEADTNLMEAIEQEERKEAEEKADKIYDNIIRKLKTNKAVKSREKEKRDAIPKYTEVKRAAKKQAAINKRATEQLEAEVKVNVKQMTEIFDQIKTESFGSGNNNEHDVDGSLADEMDAVDKLIQMHEERLNRYDNYDENHNHNIDEIESAEKIEYNFTNFYKNVQMLTDFIDSCITVTLKDPKY